MTQDLTRSLVEDLAEYADSWVAFRRSALHVPGIAVAIGFEGDLILDTAHGVADVTTGAPLTPGHLFRIASHSKTFTATAIFQLVEKGALRLDDPLATHLAWIGDTTRFGDLGTVLIGEVLSHGSGTIRDSVDGDFWQLLRAFPNEPELIELLGRQATVFPSNERFHYSNIGYSLLGLVIEKVTGASYAEHMQKAVIAPLGLTNTHPDYWHDRSSDYASGHTSELTGHQIPIDHIDTNGMAAATGFTSTAGDLVRHFNAHCFGNTTLLTDASKRRMQHPQWTQAPGFQYSSGVMVTDVGSWTVIGHSGGYPGHTTKTMCDPKSGLVISVLANQVAAPISGLCDGFMRFAEHVAGKQNDPTPRPDDVALSRFRGRFANLWDTCDVCALGNRLFVAWPDAASLHDSLQEMSVISDTQLRYEKGPDGYSNEGEIFTVDFDDHGQPVRLRGDSGMRFWRRDDYMRFVAGKQRISVGDSPNGS